MQAFENIFGTKWSQINCKNLIASSAQIFLMYLFLSLSCRWKWYWLLMQFKQTVRKRIMWITLTGLDFVHFYSTLWSVTSVLLLARMGIIFCSNGGMARLVCILHHLTSISGAEERGSSPGRRGSCSRKCGVGHHLVLSIIGAEEKCGFFHNNNNFFS